MFPVGIIPCCLIAIKYFSLYIYVVCLGNVINVHGSQREVIPQVAILMEKKAYTYVDHIVSDQLVIILQESESLSGQCICGAAIFVDNYTTL